MKGDVSFYYATTMIYNMWMCGKIHYFLYEYYGPN